MYLQNCQAVSKIQFTGLWFRNILLKKYCCIPAWSHKFSQKHVDQPFLAPKMLLKYLSKYHLFHNQDKKNGSAADLGNSSWLQLLVRYCQWTMPTKRWRARRTRRDGIEESRKACVTLLSTVLSKNNVKVMLSIDTWMTTYWKSLLIIWVLSLLATFVL